MAYVLLMLGIMVISVAILFFLRAPIKHKTGGVDEEEEQPATIKIALLKIWNMLTNRRFVAIIP